MSTDKTCYWRKTPPLWMNAYLQGCRLKQKQPLYFNDKSVKEVGFIYCPYCAGKVKVEE